MAVRVLNLLAISVFSIKLYVPAALIIFMFTLALVARFQPYKCKKNNTADIVMLLAVIVQYTSISMHLIDNRLFSNWLNRIVSGAAALTIYCYLLFLILSKLNIFVKCFKKSKLFLIFSRFDKTEHSELEVNVTVEDQVLLNHDEADYNSCNNN